MACQGNRRVLASKKMEPKECPMCGEHMRLQTRDQTDRVPGSREVRTKRITEWVCPECDYFEEADDVS
jgi:YgiT-type zinc finger domain-containing protein